jgi:hypothetical protein
MDSFASDCRQGSCIPKNLSTTLQLAACSAEHGITHGHIQEAAAVTGCPFQGSPSILMQSLGIFINLELLAGDDICSLCAFLSI